MEKNLDANYTRMLLAVLNKFWKQYPTKQRLHINLHSMTQTRAKHASHFWRFKAGHLSNVLLRTFIHRCATASRAAMNYIHQLCADTGCGLEDQPVARDDKDENRERARELRAINTVWWWKWWWLDFHRAAVWVYHLYEIKA